MLFWLHKDRWELLSISTAVLRTAKNCLSILILLLDWYSDWHTHDRLRVLDLRLARSCLSEKPDGCALKAIWLIDIG